MTQTVLVVEDDNQLRDILEIVLTETGFDVQVCPDGQVAMDTLMADKAAGKIPSMIILDLNMPVVDGWQVSKWLDADPVLHKIPVIVTSASRNEGEEAKALHADAYLVKPFTTDEILGVVELFSLLNP
jgi:two-component system, OmpR family, response regulator